MHSFAKLCQVVPFQLGKLGGLAVRRPVQLLNLVMVMYGRCRSFADDLMKNDEERSKVDNSRPH